MKTEEIKALEEEFGGYPVERAVKFDGEIQLFDQGGNLVTGNLATDKHYHEDGSMSTIWYIEISEEEYRRLASWTNFIETLKQDIETLKQKLPPK